MKKSIKLISGVLAALMAVSAFSVTASALPRPTEEECAAVGEQKIYFEFPTDGTWGDWSNIKINKLNNTVPIYCNPYAVYGNTKEFFDPGWETKPGQCVYTGQGTTVAYDINSTMTVNHYSEVDAQGKKVKLTYYRYMETQPGVDFGVLFSTTANGGYQTADVNMNVDCLGDTVVLDNPIQTRENAANSAKSDYFAHWKNHPELGVLANITSTGKFVEGQFPANQPRAQMLSSKLKDYLTNFVNVGYFQLKTNLTLMEKLGVTAKEVYDQYKKDNADILEGGVVEPANPDQSDVENGCPVEFIRYDKQKLNMDTEHKKLASLKAVQEVLGLSDEDIETTTAEPTTAEPTTAEPTTVAPATEPAPAEDVFTLAGTANWLSTGWSPDPGSYVMTKGDGGIYSITVPDVKAEEGIYAVKVVQFIGGDAANVVWHGMDGTSLNYDFGMSADGDVTVTFNPATGEINVTGPTVVAPEYDINYITAVGNGQNNWLNGVVWDPAAGDNKMTKVSEGVYEITFEEVDTNTDYMFKFAANGAWDINWGVVKDTEAKLNEANPAQYNAEDNIQFNVESEDDICNVTLRLDLTKWDTIKKGGATYTIIVSEPVEPTTVEPTTVAPTTVAPTTVEPTTVAPTTVAPTTVAPTTVEPTTVAPTTVAPTTEPAPAEDVFTLAGTSNWLSTGWSPDPGSYVMTKGDGGIYSITVPDVKAEEGIYAVKVVQFIGGDAANVVWHGMDGTSLNYDFGMSADGDVTVTFNPATGEINVTGPTVVAPEYDINYITAVGNGQNNWLNGVVWDPAAGDNKMTKVSEGVYEITFEEVDTNTDYMFKFAANGAWDINWGVVKDTEAKLNEANPAQYNAEDNIQFNVESEDDICNVTLRLDLTKWDTIKKGGATYTILVNYEPTPVYGDVDGDGFVTAVDATAIQKYSIDMPVDDNFNVVAADVNGDGRVSILDVTCVQKYVADFKTGIGRAGQPIELV